MCANDRYLNALAGVDESARLQDLTAGLEQPVRWKKARVRGLRLLGEDADLLAVVGRGEFCVNGFRNRDVRVALFAEQKLGEKEQRRQSAATGRKLRLLRAHGVIRKLPNTRRYQLTARGRHMIDALQSAKATPVNQLIKMAA